MQLQLLEKPQILDNPNNMARDYQIQLKKDLYRLLNQGIKKVLCVAATGSGKTLWSTMVIWDAVSRDRKVLFLIHRDILAEQTAATLSRFGLDYGFIIASKPTNPDAKVQISSVQTLGRRDLDYSQFDLIFYDEAHLTSWTNVGKKILKTDCWHVGLTATPWRLKKTEGMGDLFDEIINAPLPYELMEKGYLVYPRYFTLPKPDLKGVNKNKEGDYQIASLARVCNTTEVINSLVENWLQIAKGKKTIVFAVNVAHAVNIAKSFQEKGIKAKAVSGEMSHKDCRQIYQELANGEIDVISSCEKLAEGFDVPSIECVALARPTKSKAKYFQQVGRGLRISQGKETCLVLDQAGLIDSFGVIEDLRDLSLIKGEPKKDGEKGFCKVCQRGLPFFMEVCAKCADKNTIKLMPIGKLTELVIARGEKREFQFYRNKLVFAYQRGYSPDYAAMKFNEHYNKFPTQKWALNAIFGEDCSRQDKAHYLEYLCEIAARKAKNEKWVRRHYKNEFGEDYQGNITINESLQLDF